MFFWRLTPKVPHRKRWQSGAARQASTGQSTRGEGSARWAAQKGPAGSAGRLQVQDSHYSSVRQGILQRNGEQGVGLAHLAFAAPERAAFALGGLGSP